MRIVIPEHRHGATESERISRLEEVVRALVVKSEQTDGALRALIENVAPKNSGDVVKFHLGESVRSQFRK